MTDTRAELREKVAEELWQADSVRAVGTRRTVPWVESGAKDRWLPLADAAIAVMRPTLRAEVLEEVYLMLWSNGDFDQAAAIRALIYLAAE